MKQAINCGIVLWGILALCFAGGLIQGDAGPAESSLAEPADDLDSLLNLAEKDVGQLSQVNVAKPSAVMSTEVTTVSRQAKTVGKTPAAIFVITNEMIRRSGATSIPEVLRLAPGVNVARIDSNKWAISIRGFNDRFSNKLLVQVDGRTVYDPLYSGVFWDVQDVVLEDVDRIEVIRGPGGTIWGANAVNGVINIISKKAKDTQGLYSQTIVGSWDKSNNTLRYGGMIGDDISYRVYGRWFERAAGYNTSGIGDDWRQARTGFRMDWDLNGEGQDFVTFQGDLYNGYSGGCDGFGQPFPPFSTLASRDHHVSGSNTILRWTHNVSETSAWNVQFYYDHNQRNMVGLPFSYTRDTYDIDLDYRFLLGERNRFVVGTAYRATPDVFKPDPGSVELAPRSRLLETFSYFVQDEITLVEDLVTLTAGSKFLHNTYTDFEYQPSLRLLLTPTETRSYWMAVSRAVRTPSRIERDVNVLLPPNPPGVFQQITGNSGLISEDMMAYEAGMRTQVTDEFGYDLAGFVNSYDNLAGYNPGLPFLAPFGLVFPITFSNRAQAETYGFELAADYQVTERWKLRGGYSFISIFTHGDAPGLPEYSEGSTSRNTLTAQSGWDLGNNVEFDLIGRYADSLSTLGVPSYFTGDARIGWRPRDYMEVFLVGRHLLDNKHSEFTPFNYGWATQVRSELYGGVNLRF